MLSRGLREGDILTMLMIAESLVAARANAEAACNAEHPRRATAGCDIGIDALTLIDELAAI